MCGHARGIAPTPTCSTLQAYLLSTPDSNDDPLCGIAQNYFSEYCGCHHHDENDDTKQEQQQQSDRVACSICAQTDDSMEFRNQTLNLDGFPFETCGDLQDAAELLLREGTDQCSFLKALGPFCGCPRPRPPPQDEDHVAKTPCTLCRDGNPVPWTDRPLSPFRSVFGGDVFTPTCAMVDASLALVSDDSDECETARLFGSTCGCPAVPEPCHICNDPDWGDEVPTAYANRTIPQFARYFGRGRHDDDSDSNSALSSVDDLTCSDLWQTQYQLSKDDDRCYFAWYGSYLCGCNGGESRYLGADTKPKKLTLVWMPRVTGTLSILVRNDNNNKKNLLCRALVLLYSLVLFFLSPCLGAHVGFFRLFNRVPC